MRPAITQGQYLGTSSKNVIKKTGAYRTHSEEVQAHPGI